MHIPPNNAKRRYGKKEKYFKLFDIVPLALLIAIVFFRIIPPIQAILIYVSMVLIGIWDKFQRNRNGERYIIGKSSIRRYTYERGKWIERGIPLPKSLTVILSRASFDDRSGNAKVLRLSQNRSSVSSRVMYIETIQEAFMVCLVKSENLQETLNLLHWNDFSEKEKYSNTAIRILFTQDPYAEFLYSFHYETPEQLKTLLCGRDLQIILPKSLEDKVDLSGVDAPIYVDDLC